MVVMKAYPKLPKPYKNCFPFSLGTTSYIYPDDYLPNILHLAPFVDEIELLFFADDHLPSSSQIREFKKIGKNYHLSFHVHLPLDIYLGHPDKKIRQKGVDRIQRIFDLCAGLKPTFYILHLEPISHTQTSSALEQWQDWLYESLTQIKGLPLCIENLMYPFAWLEGLVNYFQFPICLDIGHVIKAGFSLETYLKKYLPQTKMLHLHGCGGKRQADHLGLSHLKETDLILIMSYLKQYKGHLCLEMFSFEALVESLRILERGWNE